MKIPDVLSKTKDLIIKSNLDFESANGDKRLDSIGAEKRIIEFLMSQQSDIIKYVHTKERDWYDLEIIDVLGKKSYFCNIKAPNDVNKNQADNAGSPIIATCYVLTGLEPTSTKYPKSWESAACFLNKNFKTVTDDDYWYVVVPKSNIKETFITSMKGLRKLTPNGNNLPFQINWSNNREYLPSGDASDNTRILNVIMQSLKKRADPYFRLSEMNIRVNDTLNNSLFDFG